MKKKVKGRALAILISLAMVFTMMPMMGVAAYAKQNTKKTESVKTLNGKGNGTESNPYQISTYAELKEFADIVNGTHDKISQNTGAWAILTDDIECTDMKWVPMATEAKPYTGTFEGNNNTIKDLSNKESEGASLADYQGLFEYPRQQVYWRSSRT